MRTAGGSGCVLLPATAETCPGSPRPTPVRCVGASVPQLDGWSSVPPARGAVPPGGQASPSYPPGLWLTLTTQRCPHLPLLLLWSPGTGGCSAGGRGPWLGVTISRHGRRPGLSMVMASRPRTRQGLQRRQAGQSWPRSTAKAPGTRVPRAAGQPAGTGALASLAALCCLACPPTAPTGPGRRATLLPGVCCLSPWTRCCAVASLWPQAPAVHLWVQSRATEASQDHKDPIPSPSPLPATWPATSAVSQCHPGLAKLPSRVGLPLPRLQAGQGLLFFPLWPGPTCPRVAATHWLTGLEAQEDLPVHSPAARSRPSAWTARHSPSCRWAVQLFPGSPGSPAGACPASKAGPGPTQDEGPLPASQPPSPPAKVLPSGPHFSAAARGSGQSFAPHLWGMGKGGRGLAAGVSGLVNKEVGVSNVPGRLGESSRILVRGPRAPSLPAAAHWPPGPSQEYQVVGKAPSTCATPARPRQCPWELGCS
ncbi:collagen alpha-3(IV) chain-like [Marmota monax]|uniref:collagen alpha-3(IV) chain-like n=1 Tax=Marmota monax TaxID=9995 RepID=UPI001EAFAA63|nr:collagen alpha-3(IV) chain-like [Marmota monax]